MKSTLTAAALLAALAAPSLAQAQDLLIDFEGPTSFASVLDYYNGGSDSEGATGPALGLVFGADLMALRNDEFSSFFSNAPTPLGVMFVAGSAEATLNIAAGFTGSLGLSYSSSAAASQAVQVWSGLGGSGSLLASLDLAANAQSGCSDSPYCHFDSASLVFAGVAKSVTFGGALDIAAIDNISVSAVPEPASALLLALGSAGLLVARRRR